jgi:hypothetical protein
MVCPHQPNPLRSSLVYGWLLWMARLEFQHLRLLPTPARGYHPTTADPTGGLTFVEIAVGDNKAKTPIWIHTRSFWYGLPIPYCANSLTAKSACQLTFLANKSNILPTRGYRVLFLCLWELLKASEIICPNFAGARNGKMGVRRGCDYGLTKIYLCSPHYKSYAF